MVQKRLGVDPLSKPACLSPLSLSLFTFSSRYVLYLLLSFFLLSLRLRVPVPYVKVEHRPMRLYRQQQNKKKDENKKFSSCNSIWFHPGTFDPVEAAG